MITAVLTMAFVCCLVFGRMPPLPLFVLCVVVGVFLAYFNRHEHAGFIPIDMLAQKSRLKTVNAALKFFTLLCLMIICVASPNPYTGVFLVIAAALMAVLVGGIELDHYIHFLALPVSFLMLGGLALLFEVSSGPTGVLNLHVFGIWLSVSPQTQARTALVIARAFGAVSCLCLLGLTTPMPGIISVLRRVRCPEVIIDLMYLIYRYIFILLGLHHEMYAAAGSRLGFRDYKTSLRSTANIYANLLARSYRFASNNFDAMESRCYDTGIRFLERRHPVAAVQAAVCAAFVIAALCLCLLVRWQ